MLHVPLQGYLRVLDFDLENRPLSYWIPDRPSAEVTAIAWGWIEPGDGVLDGEVESVFLKRTDDGPLRLLKAFRKVYDQADMVVGHYIRRHDLPIINGALLEYGEPPLGPKLTQDTKLDMPRKADMPASQEALAGMFGLSEPKEHMSQPAWRQANRLQPAGLELARARVEGDIRQNIALRAALIERGWLGPPKVWRP